MEKPEITSGIKQAIEKGYSLEQAKASFVNAGYNRYDVEDSAKSFSGVISRIPQQAVQPKPQIQSQPPSLPQSQSQPQLKPQIQTQVQENKLQSQQSIKKILFIIFIILLSAILVTLLAGLAGLIFSPDSTKDFFTKIFSFFGF